MNKLFLKIKILIDKINIINIKENCFCSFFGM